MREYLLLTNIARNVMLCHVELHILFQKCSEKISAHKQRQQEPGKLFGFSVFLMITLISCLFTN
jgi:hypothetical protein